MPNNPSSPPPFGGKFNPLGDVPGAKAPEAKAPEAPQGPQGPAKPAEEKARASQPKEGILPLDPTSFFSSLGNVNVSLGPITVGGNDDTDEGGLKRSEFNISLAFAHPVAADTSIEGYIFQTGETRLQVGIQIDPDKLLTALGNVADRYWQNGWKSADTTTESVEDHTPEEREGAVGRAIEKGAPYGFKNLFAKVFETIGNALHNLDPKFRVVDTPSWVGGPKRKAFSFTFQANGGTQPAANAHYGHFATQLANAFSTVTPNKDGSPGTIDRFQDMAKEKFNPTEGKKVPSQIYRVMVSQFVRDIPEDRFKQTHPEVGGSASKMVTKLTEDEIKSMKDGEKVLEYMKEHPSDEDNSTYKYVYAESKKIVIIENKRLTDRMILEWLQGVTKGKSSAANVFDDLAKTYDTDAEKVKDVFKNWIGSLTDKLRGQVENIFGLKEKKPGIKKEAYGVAWAGPTLEEIGRLIGTGEAQWASELAAKLAGTLDYISYPALVGSPTELAKISTMLWLTKEQAEFVQKNMKKARAIMHTLAKDIWDPITGDKLTYEERKSYGKETGPSITVGSDALNDIADEALLNLVSDGVVRDGVKASVLGLSDEDFSDELRKILGEKTKELMMLGRAALPEERTSPEDALATQPESYEPVVEKDPSISLPEELEQALKKLAGSQHAAVLDNGVPVQINVDPDMPLEARGQMGTIRESLVTFGYCEQHKRICPYVFYLVEYKSPFRGRRDDWFFSGDVMPITSLNKTSSEE